MPKDFTFTERFVSFIEPVIGDGEITVGKATIKFDKQEYKPSYESDTHALTCNVDGSIKTGVTVYLISLEQVNPNGVARIVIESK